MSSLRRIASVLLLLLSPAFTADDNRLTIYTAQTGYSITVTQIQNTPYVGLVDVLDPVGRTEARIDGNKLRLTFTPPGAPPSEFEFQSGAKTYKTGRDKPELTAPFVIQNERGYTPVASLPALLSSLLDQQIQFHESARRLFLAGAPTRFTAEIRKDTTPSLVLRFQKPVNPFIATEPGKLRMVFTRDPVISTGSDSQTFPDPLISGVVFAEHSGLAELTVNAASPLIASFSDGGRTITLSAAPGAQPPATQAANEQPSAPPAELPTTAATTPSLPLAPRAPRFLVVVDPAHGGDERGAALSDTLQEKDVTLAIGRRIAAQLEAKGISAVLIRSSDTTNSLDQRASAANSMQPALYIAVHAVSLGQGSTVFTAQLQPSASDRRSFLPWYTAQSAYLDLSSVAGGSIAAELNTRKVPVRATSASVKPLNNIAAPAIAIEVSPLSNASTLTSADYQQRIAGAVAAGVSAVRNKLEAAR